MCGIAGIFAYRESAPLIDQEELLRIREHMIKRGPDGAGLWISADQRVGLAHRRLAIIDLSEAGAQPMATADGRYRVTLNGEIYNYRELKQELEAKGHRFRSNSDTEVLLCLYAEHGADIVHRLRGMYAFGIWDERKRELFLARDPFGIKPLYYADDGSTFRFASQVKALTQSSHINLDFDPAGQAGFYLWGNVPEPYTFYKGIRAIPAGSHATIYAGGMVRIKRYFTIADELAKAERDAQEISAEAMRERLLGALEDSVRHHLVADVPVGLFLSAGLDSGTILALSARGAGGAVKAITLGFEEYRGGKDDETVLAASIAARYGAVHETRWIASPQFEENLHPFLEAMDQPTIDGLNTYLVSQAAAASGLRVALSGLGGDELFRGYPSFEDVPRMNRWLGWTRRVPAAGRAFRRVLAPALRQLTSPKYAGLLEYGGSFSGAYLLRRGLFMPWELPAMMGADAAAEGWRELETIARLDADSQPVENPRLRVSGLELSWYMRNQLLRDADWAGMAHSLEIRVPFVDATLLRAILPLMVQTTPLRKVDMALAADPAFPKPVLDRAKTGFVVPVRSWLQRRGGARTERGLRGWARKIARRQLGGNRVLVLTTDAFGGHGGIALYNRDAITATCHYGGCKEVVAMPRLMPNPPEALPPKLTYVTDGLGGKLKYLWAVLQLLNRDRRFDLVVCGHVNLLPVAWLARIGCRAPMLLCVYGIDAWAPRHKILNRWLVRRANSYASISHVTLKRFIDWTSVDPQKAIVVPNAIHLEWYRPGGKPDYLIRRYGLEGKRVIMTLGRLESMERYKGFDEILDVLPDLAKTIPNIAYLIVGGGTDRERLEQHVLTEGLAERVVFAGLIPESEKADHYRLADAFVMPSRGEGFGFVLLEAMACGVPVLASSLDGGKEALRDGLLGRLVDPRDAADTLKGVFDVLAGKKGEVPEGLEYFSYPHFEQRWHETIDKVLV